MARPGIIIPFILLLAAVYARADPGYSLEVRLYSYDNPGGRCADSNCCEIACNRPDPYFIFCLREAGETDFNVTSNCPLGAVVTRFFISDTLAITFDTGNDALLSLSNPLVLNVSESWPGEVQLLLVPLDLDTDNDDVIDIIVIEVIAAVGSSFSNRTTYDGEGGYANIDLSYRVFCAGNYYGSNCAVFCVEKDDDQGHYTCGSEGKFVCRDGYQNPLTNCTECIPAQGCYDPTTAIAIGVSTTAAVVVLLIIIGSVIAVIFWRYHQEHKKILVMDNVTVAGYMYNQVDGYGYKEELVRVR